MNDPLDDLTVYRVGNPTLGLPRLALTYRAGVPPPVTAPPISLARCVRVRQWLTRAWAWVRAALVDYRYWW